jgi:hypothetical protein
MLFILGTCSMTFGQRADVTLTLNEGFFDAVLDSLFQGSKPFEFSVAGSGAGKPSIRAASASAGECREVVRILREINGVRTAVRFRDGRILVPLAFSGGYAPPFVGCVPFSGWAEAELQLEFDERAQKLLGRIRVLSVNLTGTGGLGGNIVARMVQTAVDKRVNPVQILQLNKLSFAFPVPDAGDLRLNAEKVRTDVTNGALLVHITYAFSRS